MLLKDEAGIVTGANHGIGRAIAIALAAEGAKIIVNNYKSGEAAGTPLPSAKTTSLLNSRSSFPRSSGAPKLCNCK